MTKEEKENIKRELVLWFENSENERIGIALKKLISTEFNIIELRYKYGMCWKHIAKKIIYHI